MQKQAPSIGRILVAVGFTLSCFGLLLFLWVAFGGPIPLKSQSYRFNAYFAEGSQLASEADVRISGVSVGKVKSTELAPPDQKVDGQDTTKAVIEIKPEFAPVSTNARAILRQKTLLGETYIEITPGTEPGEQDEPVSLGAATSVSDAEADQIESIPEGGTLPTTQTQSQVQIDEIFNALDEETRAAFSRWMQGSAAAIKDRGLDVNDAFGNLGPFAGDASEVLGVLRRQKTALQGLVRDTGEVFGALSENEAALSGAVTNSNSAFEALASQQTALAETFQILPTFARESRLTFERLDAFQANTRPLILDLKPVADELSPTLANIRRLSPELLGLFGDVDQLNQVADEGLPALTGTLRELRPLLRGLDPFLANLNPIVRFLDDYKEVIPDFLAAPGVGTSDTLESLPGQAAPRHALRQLGYLSQESLSIYPDRIPENRGNAYLQPDALKWPTAARSGIFENFDCDASGGERLAGDGKEPEVGYGYAPCILPRDFESWGGGRFPQVTRDP